MNIIAPRLQQISSMNHLMPRLDKNPILINIFFQSTSNPNTNKNNEYINHKIQNKKERNLIPTLENIVTKDFPIHPFKTGVSAENEKIVLGHYLAMSEAFPYIQAGAYKDLILNCIRRNTGVEKTVEKTFVVGAFLSFDETGGNYLLRTKGISALPEILQTNRLYHSSLLKQDIQTLLGQESPANYKYPTANYLQKLLENLGSRDHVQRCASMVAFELHAGEMIEALWGSLATLHPEIKKDSLDYFKVHVGGDDPQEEYHKQLTKKMTQDLISQDEEERFLKYFKDAYEENIFWCQSICNPSDTIIHNEVAQALWGSIKEPKHL